MQNVRYRYARNKYIEDEQNNKMFIASKCFDYAEKVANICLPQQSNFGNVELNTKFGLQSLCRLCQVF